jgi:hypothetical protein
MILPQILNHKAYIDRLGGPPIVMNPPPQASVLTKVMANGHNLATNLESQGIY